MAPRRREPTATERLQTLAELRARNSGYIVPQPQPLTPQAFRDWLHAIAEVGAPGDVEVAWHYYPDAAVKKQLRSEYEALCTQAGQRHGMLEAAAWREDRQDHAAAEGRTERARVENQIAAYEAAIVSLRKKLEGM